MGGPYPTSLAELTARVVALEAGLTALRQVLDERDKRYSQRSESQDLAVASALQTSEKAIIKAEAATEKRLEGLNELRSMAEDQAKYFARTEVINPRIDALDVLVKASMARRGGVQEAWGQFAVAAGLIIAATALYFRH
jgi:hypothetical protein